MAKLYPGEPCDLHRLKRKGKLTEMRDNMWYVIQTFSGEEEIVKKMLLALEDEKHHLNCFIPMHENVWIKANKPHISLEKLFKGYLFVETDAPEQVFYKLKEIYHMSNLLNDKNEHGYTFLTIMPSEQEFFSNVLDEQFVMRLSYVHKDKKGRIDQAIGPLSEYVDKIVKVDWHHRRVLVDIELFGRLKRVKFGITLNKSKLHQNIISKEKSTGKEPDIKADKWDWKARIKTKQHKDDKEKKYSSTGNIKPGDMVRNTTGIYGDAVYRVHSCNEKRHTVMVEVPMFGSLIYIEMNEEELCIKERML